MFFSDKPQLYIKKIKIFLNQKKIVKQVENFSGIQSMNRFTLNFPPQHTIPYELGRRIAKQVHHIATADC